MTLHRHSRAWVPEHDAILVRHFEATTSSGISERENVDAQFIGEFLKRNRVDSAIRRNYSSSGFLMGSSNAMRGRAINGSGSSRM